MATTSKITKKGQVTIPQRIRELIHSDVVEFAVVGKDIMIVGFDDAPEASQPPYSLTSFKQDFSKLAMEATRLLIEKIHHPDDWKTRHILFPTPLIVRKSTGGG